MQRTLRFLCLTLVVLADEKVSAAFTKKLFGNGSDYIFPCHCADDAVCDEKTGECPDGRCATLLPDDFGWAGPACQVGNVAYGKLAESNTVVDEKNTKYNKPHLWHSADFLVDGSFEKNVFGGSCSVVYTDSKSNLAWWMVDLGEAFAIHNLTLVNTENSVDASYLEQFNITVGNSSDRSSHSVCVHFQSRISKSEHKVFTCDQFQVGRYISVSKYQERNKVGRLPLCEVVVWGHQWLQVDWKWCADDTPNGIWCDTCFGDTSPSCHDAPCVGGTYGVQCSGICGHCAQAAPCNTRTGHCERCAMGWKPPLCQQQCEQGTYGFHCLQSCGHCKGYCEVINGTCPNGCSLWYLGSTCDVNIPPIDLDYVTQFYSLFEKDTSVILHMPIPEDAMDPHHAVILEYLDEHNPMAAFQEHHNFSLHYNNATYWIKMNVFGLKPNTQYWFRVSVSRSHMSVTEKGKPSPAHKVTTRPPGPDPKVTASPATTTNTTSVSLTTMARVASSTQAASAAPVIPYHLHLSALIASLVLIALLLTAVPLVACYLRRARGGSLTMGRYVNTNGIENHFYMSGEECQADASRDNGKADDSCEYRKCDDNIYSVLSNTHKAL